MMKLSGKAQDILRNLPVEDTGVSPEEKEDLYRLVMQKIEPQLSQKPVVAKRKFRPVSLIAAVVAAFSLLGAGYATSVYWDKMFRSVDSPISQEEIDFEDDSDFLVEPPVFEHGEPSPENEGLAVKIDSYSPNYLAAALRGRSPGELFEVEIHGPGQKLKAKGIAGTGLGLLYTVSERGMPQVNLVVNEEKPPTTQQVLDNMAAGGEFIVTLDNPQYTAVDLSWIHGTSHFDLRYADPDGMLVSLYFQRSEEKIPISRDWLDKAAVAELERKGNHYVLIEFPQGELGHQLYLYLGEYDEVYNTSVFISYQNGTREQLLAVMDSIAVHNRHSNAIKPVDEAFFAGFPQEEIRINAGEIAGAIAANPLEKNVVGYAQPIWEGDGLSVGVYDVAGRHVSITAADAAFDENSPLYPFDVRGVLAGQPWFPGEKLKGYVLLYQGDRPVWAGYRSEDDRYSFGATIPESGFIASPLDAILQEMNDALQREIVKAIDPDSHHPIVVTMGENSAWIYSATKAGNNRFLVETLRMPKDALPPELSN